jgi:hypothetical protein
MHFCHGKKGSSANLDELIENTPNHEFAKVTRSTIPLLTWMQQGGVEALCQQLGMKPPTKATLEYEVSARCKNCGSTGKSSFTDLMLETDDAAIAIEAKYTEGLYENVSAWLPRTAKPENKKAVLKHWLRCHLKLDEPHVFADDLIYQLVHRTASACAAAAATSKPNAHVVLLLFGNKHLEEYVAASELASRLLKQPNFSVVHVPAIRGKTSPTGWRAVKDALRGPTRLYTFGTPEFLLPRPA